MKLKGICLILFLAPLLAVAQGVFSRKLTVNQGEYIYDIQGSSDGGQVMVYSQGAAFGLCKTDGLGNLLWSTVTNTNGTRLEIAPDGSLFTIAGGTLSKFTNAGAPVWAVSLTMNVTDFDIADDGEIYCTGVVGSSHGACKLDANGAVVWARSFTGIRVTDICASAAGGAYVTGNAQSSQFEYQNGTLLKLSDAGTLLWSWQAGSLWMKFRKVVETPDLQVTVAANDVGTFIGTNVFRFDASGTPLWNKLIGPVRTQDAVQGLAGLNDNSVAIIANSSDGSPSFYADMATYWISGDGASRAIFANMEYGTGGTSQAPVEGCIAATSDGNFAYAYSQYQGYQSLRKAFYGKLAIAGSTCKPRANGSAISWNATTNAVGISTNALTVTSSASTASVSAGTLQEQLICSYCMSSATASFSSSVSGFDVTFTNASNNALSYLWDFGDGSSSTSASPVHAYAQGGSYNVCLTVTGACDQATSCQTVVVVCATSNTPYPLPTLLADVTTCTAGAVAIGAASGYASYLWSNGATTASTTFNAPGSISLTVQDPTTNCLFSDNATATVVGTPISLGPDQMVCPGVQLALSPGSGFATYLWSNGSTSSSITVSAPGTYAVTVTDQQGCTNSDEMVLSNLAAPAVSLGPNQSICAGGSVTLNAGSGYASYLWSTGATTQSITATAAGTYAVTVTNANGCSGSASTSITVNPLPAVSISASNGGTICFGSAVTLTATSGYAAYSWSGGGTTNTKVASTAGTYTVTVTNANGCTNTASATVNAISTCAVPTSLVASGITTNSATLSWAALPCVASYSLQYRKSGAGSWTTVTATSNSIVISGLLANKTYEWRVKTNCTGSGGSSAYSGSSTFATAANKMAEDLVDDAALSILLYPNPNHGAFALQYPAETAGLAQISAYDMMGKCIYDEVRPIGEGLNHWELDFGMLAQGMYVLRISGKGTTQNLSFIVQ